MVLKKAKEFYVDIWKKMRIFRDEKKFIDISIIIEQERIDAHKCVLAAGSDYFNSLFAGSFTESTLNVIDLSKITEDVVSFKAVVKFLYSGEINIEDNNFRQLVKLSSYLLIVHLQDLCIEYMIETLNLSTCLKYYLCSVHNSLIVLEKKTSPVVKSRFHDYIIFQEDTLKISEKDLFHLFHNGFLEFCSVPSLLCFLADWVIDQTETRMSLAIEILDCLILGTYSTELPHKMEFDVKIQSAYERMVAKLDVRFVLVLVRKFKTIMAKYSDGRCLVIVPNWHMNPMDCGQSVSQPTTERVVISLSPRQCLKEDIDNYKRKDSSYTNKQHFDEAVFDICIYIPRTRTWCYLKSMEDSMDCSQIRSNDFWEFRCIEDKLWCSSPSEVNLYSLQKFTWRDLGPFCTFVFGQLSEGEHISPYDYELVFSANKVYMLHKICIGIANDSWSPSSECIFFKCFKLNLDETWDFLFNTPKIDTKETNGFSSSCISSVSNEMLINVIRNDKEILHCSFIVNLNADIPVATQIYPSESQELIETKIPRESGVQVLEGKDHFIVTMKDHSYKDSIKLCSLFQYKFFSKVLSICTGSEVLLEDYDIGGKISFYPCSYSCRGDDTHSMWFFSGNKDDANQLSEVTVDEHGKLVLLPHTPPPFSCVTGLCAGTVRSDIIKNLKPIKTYLMSDL